MLEKGRRQLWDVYNDLWASLAMPAPAYGREGDACRKNPFAAQLCAYSRTVAVISASLRTSPERVWPVVIVLSRRLRVGAVTIQGDCKRGAIYIGGTNHEAGALEAECATQPMPHGVR